MRNFGVILRWSFAILCFLLCLLLVGGSVVGTMRQLPSANSRSLGPLLLFILSGLLFGRLGYGLAKSASQASEPGSPSPEAAETVGLALLALVIVYPIYVLMRNNYYPTPEHTWLRKGSEDQSKGDLGAMRSAISIYYGDMEGQYPVELNALTIGGKYLVRIPRTKTSWHRDSADVLLMTNEQRAAQQFTDTGGWYYVIDGSSLSNRGSVGVNCTHTDTHGKDWFSF